MTSDLLLLPGLNCDERLWRDVVAELDILAMVADLRQDDSIAAMAAQTLAAAPPRFALAGLSMGGYVALEIMRQAPERVTHLALLDTSARPDDEARKQTRRGAMAAARGGKFALVAQAQQPNLLAPQHLGTPLAEEVLDMAARNGVEAYCRQQEAIMGRIDSRPGLGAITVPVLVGVGAHDSLTPPALAGEMADAIAGAELTVFPDAGHLSAMENPSAVAAAMRHWLAR